MSKITTLKNSFYSSLDGLSCPDDNCKRAKELGIKLLNISDHGVCGGHLSHLKATKKYGINCALGVELYSTREPAPTKLNRYNDHLVIWAKNRTGLKSLWKMVGLSNHPDYFYYRPRIHLKNTNGYLGIEEFTKDGNIMGFSGHMGSKLQNFLFANPKDDPKQIQADIRKAYVHNKNIKDSEYFRQFLKDGWLDTVSKMALEYESVFGKGNFFIELQDDLDLTDEVPYFLHPLSKDCLREVAKNTGIKAVASTDNHYARREQFIDQRLLLLTQMRTTERDVRARIDDPEEGEGVMGFFTSQAFYLKSYEEMAQKFTKEELDNTNLIADQIEQYSLEEGPRIPVFQVPEFKTIKYPTTKTKSDEYLLHLCIEGSKSIKPWEKTKKSKQEYWDRLKNELDIIFSVGLSDYFLMVQDMCKYCDFAPEDRTILDWKKNLHESGKIKPIPRGPGRGSASGCLISYVIGITKIDPLEYGLIFSRFYNHGRNKGKYVSYPDIDVDVSSIERDCVLNYLKYKYKHISQVATFLYMKGRSSLKDCFRAKNSKLSIEEINNICENVGIESKIMAEINDMKQEDEDYNILKWTIDNSEEFKQYYENPEIKPIIEQAIRLEGTIRGMGKHASGILIFPEPIENHFPTCIDTKTKEQMVATSMNELEVLGGVKVDLLGISTLDRMKMCEELVNKKYAK